jgi:hypothetical protein
MWWLKFLVFEGSFDSFLAQVLYYDVYNGLVLEVWK